MNKYIRTKDRIFEVNENGETYNGYGCKSKNGTVKIHKKDIIKEADTIEELVDEFVIKHINNSNPYVVDEYQKTEILKDRQKAFVEYGVEEVKCAIWTDKGLIYVAKMNEKGELELI